ncbi:hypothetical protein B9Z19DRAFT_1064430 [Tuber borchii]|uniref:C2H2-type domain-containing protein n=1 Tax=Tuber borchii TaxID=42251 RepID=A0A2T6ZUJ9_TUBBO|nr:hypothetical protein B9Z19DRAFT_1064430 [Tuber borchii]
MNRTDSNDSSFRHKRVKGILGQEVLQFNQAGETKYRPNTAHVFEGAEFLFNNNNVLESCTPYESIQHETLYLEAPGTLSKLEDVSRYLAPGPHTAPKSTASNSNTLTRTPMHTVGHGRGTTTSSKRGRETTGKSSSHQGPAQKRTRRNRATSAVRSNNGRDAGGGGEEDEDEDDEDDEDDESDEDDGLLIHSGPKELQALPCPMPSCESKGKKWDNWNNLIQHLQNTHIRGFGLCGRGCGRRFGLSSQYTRHVFKHKKKCKPLSCPPQRIPPLALDLNHAVSRVKGQNYEKLKQVIAAHEYYDLEDPSSHQYNPQEQQLTGWAEQIINLVADHQRVCQAYHQTGPPPSSQLNHPPSSIANRQAPRNPINSMMPSQLNQSAIHPPDVYSTQPPATATYHPSFQNGSSNPSGGHIFSEYCYPLMGGDRASQYLAHTDSFIGNYDDTRANRGAPPELDYDPATLPEYHFNPGATHGNGTGDATRFNRGA